MFENQRSRFLHQSHEFINVKCKVPELGMLPVIFVFFSIVALQLAWVFPRNVPETTQPWQVAVASCVATVVPINNCMLHIKFSKQSCLLSYVNISLELEKGCITKPKNINSAYKIFHRLLFDVFIS